MISLENEIASALTADTITAAELATLVARAEAAIVEYDTQARRNEDFSF